MAKSLRSKRRRKNKQVMRARLKPKHDAHLAAIVKNMQAQTDELMETAGNIDLSEQVTIVDPSAPSTDENMDIDKQTNAKNIKIPKVDINKVVKFMSQRKLRTFKAKQKAEKKRQKGGQKKKKQFKW